MGGVSSSSSVEIAALSGPEAASTLAALRAGAPVARVAAIGGWLVTGYREAVAVMRDPGAFTVDDPRFSTAQVVGASMLSLDGAEHRRHRDAFAAPFRPRRVQERFATETEALACGLLDAVRADGAAEVRTQLAGPLSVAIVTSALGLPDLDARTVLDWYRDIVAAVTAISAGDPSAPAAAAAMRQLAEHVRAGLDNAQGSVLSEARGHLDTAEIVANSAVLMFGGIETTEAMITNAVLQVLLRPDVLAAVRADPGLVPAAVEESLRLEPAAAVVDRYATAPVHLGGADIAAGDLVRVSLTAANRDPAVFADPDTFDLTRANLSKQLAFAQGPHLCLAMELARLETRVALAAVVDLPGVRLVSHAPPQGLVFRKPDSVRISWDVDQSC